MNKPQQSVHENYIPYIQLFTPIQPFTKYTIYNKDLFITLEPTKIGFYQPIGLEIKDYINKFIKTHDLDFKINLNFDSKELSFMYKSIEILRLDFDHYILENDYAD